MQKKVPDYMLRMIGDYLSDKWVIYEGGKWSQRRDDIRRSSWVHLTHGLGPLVWIVMYVDFLRLDLPAGANIMGFVDDALVVCVAEASESWN